MGLGLASCISCILLSLTAGSVGAEGLEEKRKSGRRHTRDLAENEEFTAERARALSKKRASKVGSLWRGEDGEQGKAVRWGWVGIRWLA